MQTSSLTAELARIVGPERVLSAPEDLLCYAYDGTFLEGRPDAVVTVHAADEVEAVLDLANREHVPVIPRGSATNLSGGTVPLNGGIVLNLTAMNRIVEIDGENLVAVVQPGVITGVLKSEVERRGLYYPPDPQSYTQSTLGGNVAENAGGPHCLKYGVTAQYVLGLEAVTPRVGRVRCGGRVLKNVTGYQLHQLFVGSEGTLGVVTEITLRLIPLPRHRLTAMAVFDDLDAASRVVSAIIAARIVPSALEFMDQTALRCIDPQYREGFPPGATAVLLIETDGNDRQAVSRELEEAAEICRAGGATRVDLAHTEAESVRLWAARRSVGPGLIRLRPNKMGEDVCVPRTTIPTLVRRVAEIARRHELIIPVFGHAGDGNFHPNILFDRRNGDEWKRVKQAASEIFALAIELGGTLSGEHGIGLLKRDWLPLALGPQVIELMRAVKTAFDPNGILNPGVGFPPAPGEQSVWG